MEDVNLLMAQGLELATCEAILESAVLRRRAQQNNLALEKITIKAIADTLINTCTSESEGDLEPKKILDMPWSLKPKILQNYLELCCKMKEALTPNHWKVFEILLQEGTVFDCDVTSWSQALNGEAQVNVVAQLCPQLKELVDTSHILTNNMIMWSNREHPPNYHANIMVYTPNLDDFPKIKGPFWDKTRVLKLKNALPRINPLEISTSIWENIKLLVLYFPLYHFETFDLSKLDGLKKLTDLDIDIKMHPSTIKDKIVPKLLQIWQQIPSLETLGCSALHQNPALTEQFLEEFGEKSDGRTLTLAYLELVRTLKAAIPPNLRIKKLCVYSPESGTSVERMCQIPTDGMEALLIKNSQAFYTYMLTGALGANLRTLEIKCKFAQSLELHRVMAAAPSLAHFEIDLGDHFIVEHPIEKLIKPAYFRKLKQFVVGSLPLDDYAEVLLLFKMFLQYSQVWDTLVINNEPILDAALDVFKQHPECIVRTRELRMFIGLQQCTKALQLAAFTLLNSPVLEKILIRFPQSIDQRPASCEKFAELAKHMGVHFSVVVF